MPVFLLQLLPPLKCLPVLYFVVCVHLSRFCFCSKNFRLLSAFNECHFSFPLLILSFSQFFSEGSWREHRLCDYDGRYYCTKCHWDALSVIPARVVHNWDFTERRVCCNCYSFLRLMVNRPVMNLDHLNSQLYQFVVDLASLKVSKDMVICIVCR